MPQSTTHAHSQTVRVPSRRRRLRAAVGIGLAAGLLVTGTACSSDDDSSTPSTPAGQDDTTAGGADLETVRTTVSTLKVCDLVDLKPLTAAMKSPGYRSGPEDIEKGVGVDPGGPQCSAMIEIPSGKSSGGVAADVMPARINIAVVAYGDKPQADKQFTDRIAESEDFTGKRTLTSLIGGGWNRGKVVTVQSDSENLVHALVQKDAYLVKVYLQTSNDANRPEKFGFTLADLKEQVIDMMRNNLFPNVEKAVAG